MHGAGGTDPDPRARQLQLHEIAALPDPPAQVVPNAGDVLLGEGRVPAPADPAADAAPGIAGSVLTASLQRVEPALVALEARPPDRVGSVRIHRRRLRDARPRRGLEGIACRRMPEACGPRPGRPSGAKPVRGGAAFGAGSQSPMLFRRHQLSLAGFGLTMASAVPHLQAAQRRISWVVPAKSPSTRTLI